MRLRTAHRYGARPSELAYIQNLTAYCTVSCSPKFQPAHIAASRRLALRTHISHNRCTLATQPSSHSTALTS